MKTIFFVALFLLSNVAQANKCLNLFIENPLDFLSYEQEFSILAIPSSEILKEIEPNTRGLLLDQRVKTGDQVYIEFTESLSNEHPTTSKGAAGYILGTKLLVNEKGHTNLHYFIYTKPNGYLISFTQSLIDFEHSRVIKRKYGQSLH